MRTLSLVTLSLMGVLMIGCSRSDDLLKQQVVPPANYPKTDTFGSYAKEFPGPYRRIHELGYATNGLSEQLESFDSDRDSGLCVAITVKDPGTLHPIRELHLWGAQGKTWGTVEMLPNIVPFTPQFVKQGKQLKILLITFDLGKRHQPQKLCLYDPESKQADFLSSGMRLEVSPDRKYALFCSSEWQKPFFLYLFDVEQNLPVKLFSFEISDSGVGLKYHWSADSRAILLSGKVSKSGTEVRLVYIVAEKRFYSLP